MTNNIAIRIENITKAYQLGLIGGGTLSDDISRRWAKLLGKPDPMLLVDDKNTGKTGDYVHALRGIDLDIIKGEIIGFIGKNGAGKSTILKIISQITAPTTGKISINGRIGSLLEVGTGFHPELTGRENIYLNGCILGMNKDEVTSKLDDIIDFSGVELYVDTPVKRYSSGMLVRLAFAVAAHLEPEILVVDEVLAVGDASFQKKCIGKMKEISSSGRTVLFVSHNMGSIIELCDRAVLLNNGKITYTGIPEKVIKKYIDSINIKQDKKKELTSIVRPNANLKKEAILESCELNNGKSDLGSWNLNFGDTIIIIVRFKLTVDLKDIRMGLNISDIVGKEICTINSFDKKDIKFLEKGNYKIKISLPHLRLLPDSYIIGLGIKTGKIDQDYINNAAILHINMNKKDTELNLHKRKGIIAPDIEFQLEDIF